MNPGKGFSISPGRLPQLLLAFLIGLAAPSSASAEEKPMHVGELSHAIDRLGTTARVLYLAAHPDDENTRLLAYLANERHLTVGYLSMTRGGGGQNLIGTEQDELLDAIRTQELLAARRLDGGLQRFTRMRDFGYTKTAAEALSVWGHDEALADVVFVIRSFQPDVIITRFDVEPPNHGHHTASAVLAREAFEAAADPARFAGQLALGVKPWRTDRLLYNVAQWNPEQAKRGPIKLDVGGYDARLGLSWGELAARSRSMHKSQGFGVPGERGPLIEKFESVLGTNPKSELLDGLDLGWGRFGAKGAAVGKAVAAAKAAFDPERPERAIPALLTAHAALDRLQAEEPRIRDARRSIERSIAGAAGLFVRAVAARPGGVPKSEVPVKLEVVMRRPANLTLARVVFPDVEPIAVGAKLGVNEKQEIARDVPIRAGATVSVPYWLEEKVDPRWIGEPEGPAPLAVQLEIKAGARTFTIEAPLVYVWTDSVQGERERRFLIVPPATVTPARKAVMLPNGKPGEVVLRVRAGQDGAAGKVRLPLPAGWRSNPAEQALTIEKAGAEVAVRFEVTPPRADAAPLTIAPVFESGGTAWSLRADVIDHPHIPMQVVLQKSVLRLVPLTIALPKGTVGYVMGPGDTVAEDLSHVGLDIELLDDETLRSANLDRFSAILIGIRAYNTREVLRSVHPRLMSYVERGGTVVAQYNTTNRWEPLDTPIGPYPFTIGRERITDQTAAMIAKEPKSPLLLVPNAIGAADYQGWVQERGLYFAEKWDERYRPLYEMTDPGEKPLSGGLIFATHGKGRYVYTGLGFFRQLPAGVPGAYRLLVNLLGAGR